MSMSNGLARLGMVFKVLGYLCIAIALYGWFFGDPKEQFNIVILLGLPGAALWVVGWVIQGFAKQG